MIVAKYSQLISQMLSLKCPPLAYMTAVEREMFSKKVDLFQPRLYELKSPLKQFLSYFFNIRTIYMGNNHLGSSVFVVHEFFSRFTERSKIYYAYFSSIFLTANDADPNFTSTLNRLEKLFSSTFTLLRHR